MTVGALRERIALKCPITIDDGMGGQSVTKWKTVAEAWAEVKARGGGETLTASQPMAQATYTISMRYRADISVRDRLEWRERELEVHAVLDKDGRRRWLELVCGEIQS